ncbi:MAG: ABC transporter substrate-binding protein [Oscillospiraceae bacterium]|nr:ABC transporter substrate-binding protein [Oscillospiraceae bacterium]
MKKIIVFAITLALAFSLVPNAALAAEKSVTVYNWGQYISDGSEGYIDVNKAFTEATGIKVNYVTFDSNETLYSKLKAGGESIDVIIPSDYMIARMISEDMLLPLDFSNIPNYDTIDDAYRNTTFDPENLYSVPYTWGTVGIIYNSKYVDEEDVGSWDLLWNAKYADKILMFDNPRDAFAVTENLLGYSLNTEVEDELRACTYKLVEQKPLVQNYVMDQIYDKMIREEAWIAPYYAGDYLMMVEDNEDLEFCFPEEGFNLFIDAMCIPDCCTNKENAEAYINFLCSPEISGQNLEYLGYSVPSEAAKEFMDPEVTESDIAYPDEETLSRGEAFINLSTEANQLMDSLWLEVKTEGGIELTPIIGISVCVLAAIVLLARRSIVTKRRKANRCKKWRTN